jgi:hypothetical protein
VRDLHAWHIFKYQGGRLDGFDNLDILLEKLIPRVRLIAPTCKAKTLARWTTDQNFDAPLQALQLINMLD